MKERKPVIKSWAEDDRPREKLLSKGAIALSNAELLALLIGSGNRDLSALDLMQKVLTSCNQSLETLSQWSPSQFKAFKGLGDAKISTIQAAFELGRRRNIEQSTPIAIKSPKDIFLLFNPLLGHLTTEEFWILLLNQAGKVIDKKSISAGGIDGTYVDLRIILREALLAQATQLAIIHNHPSGNTTPSINDKSITTQIQKGCKMMNIHLIDHVIISKNKYFSFADESLL